VGKPQLASTEGQPAVGTADDRPELRRLEIVPVLADAGFLREVGDLLDAQRGDHTERPIITTNFKPASDIPEPLHLGHNCESTIAALHRTAL
jgi:hypothetical protein